jgi:hypothetical protein
VWLRCDFCSGLSCTTRCGTGTLIETQHNKEATSAKPVTNPGSKRDATTQVLDFRCAKRVLSGLA